MRNKAITQAYYLNQLGFRVFDASEYPDYLMVEKDQIQLHFFLFEDLDPTQNYGQVYIRTNDIETFYGSLLDRQVTIHPAAPLQTTP